jgi:hypothetical protein
MKKKEKKSIFKNHTFMSIFITIVCSIVFVALQVLVKTIKEKNKEIVKDIISNIVITSAIESYEKIDQGEVVYHPIKDRHLRYGEEIISQKEVISRCIKVKNKTVLMISSHVVSYIDAIKLNKHGLRNPSGGFKEIGYISTRILFEEIRRSGDSDHAHNRYIPELSASCSFPIELEPGITYKVRVESIYCGYLARPRTTVVLTEIGAEDSSLLELLESSEDNKRSVFLDIEVKDKNQTFDLNKPGGIQPAVAGPTVNRNKEAQKGEKPGASPGVRYPEAVKGQR